MQCTFAVSYKPEVNLSDTFIEKSYHSVSFKKPKVYYSTEFRIILINLGNEAATCACVCVFVPVNIYMCVFLCIH